ncbi:MAG: hypothetical protein FJZ98_00590 [Chloroflexi bacterium]|nr:hypothetical protein [Chloroflexota bacterium]
MNKMELFERTLTYQERQVLDTLDSPSRIQSFLDSVEYPSSEENRSCVEVLRQRKAHCLDGGLFAAMALRRIGFPPRIIDLQPDPGRDDDHVLALYQIEGSWGAVAKSNYSGLRFREAIYRNTRELTLSYFENFFNVLGEKTLRTSSRVIHLERFDHLSWMTDSRGVDVIEEYLKQVKTYALITKEQAARLSLMDKRSFEAGTLGINFDGTFNPEE